MSLNPRQERFAEFYVQTGNATEAHRLAGYKAKGNAAEASASEILRNPKVQKRIKEIRAENRQNCTMTRKDLSEWYIGVITGREERRQDQLKAAEQLTRLNGWNEPEKSEVKITSLAEELRDAVKARDVVND